MNMLASAGADRLSERVALVAALGEQRLSDQAGLVLFALVLIPVLIASLNVLQLEAIGEPTGDMLDAVLQAIPNIFAAAQVIAIAFVVGRLVAGLISRILSGVGYRSQRTFGPEKWPVVGNLVATKRTTGQRAAGRSRHRSC